MNSEYYRDVVTESEIFVEIQGECNLSKVRFSPLHLASQREYYRGLITVQGEYCVTKRGILPKIVEKCNLSKCDFRHY